MVEPGLRDRLGPSVASRLVPHGASVDFEAFRNLAGVMVVTPRRSDRVYFRLCQRRSRPSRWVQHHPRLGFRHSWLFAPHVRLRLLPRGTQPFQPLPRVRAEPTGVHPTHRARTLAIVYGFGSGLVAVLGPGQGVGVVAVVGHAAADHLVEFGRDAVLLALEHGERDGICVGLA